MSGSIFPLEPGKVSWNSKIKPKWETAKFVSAAQGRKTLIHQEYPTWQFDISFPALNSQELDALLAFHMTCKGTWNPFFYKDYERYKANVTLKDGETYYYKANGLPLTIPLSVGDYTFGEPCYMADLVRVYRDGVEDTENFEVQADETGALRVYLTDVETEEGTLQTTVITATYEYYYKVAFTDSITVNQKYKNIYSVSLSLETVKQAITNTGDNDKWAGEVHTAKIIQSDHQQIIVKKYVNSELKGTYTGDFQFMGSCILEVTIEYDSGYIPGNLYINNRKYASGVRLTVNEDVSIMATGAMVGYLTFINGSTSHPYGWSGIGNQWFNMYLDSACTTGINRDNISGRLRCIDVNRAITHGDCIFGYAGDWTGGGYGACRYVTIIDQDIDTSAMTNMQDCFNRCYQLQEVDVSNWDMSNNTSLYGMFRRCNNLRKTGDISRWNVGYVTTANSMFYECSIIDSIDLSGWTTPVLANCGAMFQGCSALKTLDISGWNTETISNVSNMFSGCSALKYIIMDAEEIKFSGDVALPNANSNVLYLVPASMVESYRAHANWSGRANRIVSIDDYIIVRDGSGHITVTERT